MFAEAAIGMVSGGCVRQLLAGVAGDWPWFGNLATYCGTRDYEADWGGLSADKANGSHFGSGGAVVCPWMITSIRQKASSQSCSRLFALHFELALIFVN